MMINRSIFVHFFLLTSHDSGGSKYTDSPIHFYVNPLPHYARCIEHEVKKIKVLSLTGETSEYTINFDSILIIL